MTKKALFFGILHTHSPVLVTNSAVLLSPFAVVVRVSNEAIRFSVRNDKLTIETLRSRAPKISQFC